MSHFRYLRIDISYRKNRDVEVKIQPFESIYSTISRVLVGKTETDIRMNIYIKSDGKIYIKSDGCTTKITDQYNLKVNGSCLMAANQILVIMSHHHVCLHRFQILFMSKVFGPRTIIPNVLLSRVRRLRTINHQRGIVLYLCFIRGIFGK